MDVLCTGKMDREDRGLAQASYREEKFDFPRLRREYLTTSLCRNAWIRDTHIPPVLQEV